jgi:hypothetical protein
MLTTFFIILRRKWNQLTYSHVYHAINGLLITYAYELSNLKLIHGFTTLSILSSVLKFFFYFLNCFTHVSALYRFLRRFKGILKLCHNLMLSFALIHSIKFLFCDNFVIILIHVVDCGIAFSVARMKNGKIKIL